MIDIRKLSVGIMFPIEAYEGAIPKMENQIKLAQQAEANGFDSLWVRDIPLNNPDFKDVGQIYDPWVYLSYVASMTQTIKIGTASVILPLRHPIHVAKAAASLDALFPNRFHMGVASGDRPAEYPAFNKPFELRSAHFSEHLQMLRDFWKKFFPTYNNDYGTLLSDVGDVIPKPLRGTIPMYVTGHAGGLNIEWIAEHSDGWMYYPRDFAFTSKVIKDWREALNKTGQLYKPYIQPVYIDLVDNPDAEPQKMDLGFRLGRNYLIDMFITLKNLGVNHAILVMKYASRPMDELIDEIGKEVLPKIQ
ncbi:MAG: LLM class oxidoreductase [Capnocytophaga sp.]|nr:LLM class oxidoreductase [Capnocytophaga sp.]